MMISHKQFLDYCKAYNLEHELGAERDEIKELGKAGFDQVPGYAIHIKRHDTFKDWAKAMKELQYKFSFLTNEFRQLLSY